MRLPFTKDRPMIRRATPAAQLVSQCLEFGIWKHAPTLSKCPYGNGTVATFPNGSRLLPRGA